MSDDFVNSITVPGTVTLKQPEPPSFYFHGNKNEMLFVIKPDGTIERGPAFTTEDEMSLRFWELIAQAFPAFLEKAKQ